MTFITSNQETNIPGKSHDSNALTDYLEVINKHLIINDSLAIVLIPAMAVAHCTEGEMLWVRIYGASRSGKTELLRQIARHPDSTQLEVITPASIRGGLSGGHRLLERINNKLVVTKDLAAILTARKETRNETFGVLRNVKDGSLISDFGTEDGLLEQKSKFDWLIGTTPVFSQYKAMEDLLGARYIDLAWLSGQRDEIAQKALENNDHIDFIRAEMAEAMIHLINSGKKKQNESPVMLSEQQITQIVSLADLTALLRSPVSRDKLHKVIFQPMAEIGSELAQGLSRIAKGLLLVGITNIMPYMARICKDCIPFNRQALLPKLLDGSLGAKTDEYGLQDLHLLGACDRMTGGHYKLKTEYEGRVAEFLAYWN